MWWFSYNYFVAREDDKVDFSIPGDIVRILGCIWFKCRDKTTVSRVASWQSDNDSLHTRKLPTGTLCRKAEIWYCRWIFRKYLKWTVVRGLEATPNSLKLFRIYFRIPGDSRIWKFGVREICLSGSATSPNETQSFSRIFCGVTTLNFSPGFQTPQKNFEFEYLHEFDIEFGTNLC